MPKKTVLFMSGSSQVGSSNWRMVGAAAALADGDMADAFAAVTLNLAEYELPVFIEGQPSPIPDDAAKLRKAVAAADAIFMSSDEYTGAFSSVFRNAAGWIGHDVDPALHKFLLELGANVYSQKFELGSTSRIFRQDGSLSPSVQKQLVEGAFARLAGETV